MKNLLRVSVVTGIVLALVSGCSPKKQESGSKSIKIGIAKYVTHEALDAVEKGIIDVLEDSGREITINRQDAAADVNAAAQIAALFRNEKVSAAIGIATPTAIALANTIKDVPVVFSAVTNPINAGLVDNYEKGKGNVTGVSDGIDVLSHIRIFSEIAKIKTLGYIYTSSEDNSVSSLADVRVACTSLGLKLIEQAITNSSELKQAAQAIAGRVDGIYITNDNTVYSALPALIEVCIDAKKPLFSADVTSCRNGGALIAMGFNYYKIGVATGKMTLEILDGKKPAEIPTRFMTEKGAGDFLIDLDQAANCGITVPEEYLAQANMIFQNGALTEK
jgi:putative ABC transport system substrate-binding protein